MLPLFHPTTTILVDDVPSYLESVKDAAPAELPIMTFSSPEKAIEHIRRQNDLAKARFGEFLDISTDTDRVVIENRIIQEQITRLSISGLNRKISVPTRFNEISVIICDYAMPSMSGTDFFEQLGDIPQKRILLTGEADETIAVKAFNDGIIDRFMTKGQRGVIKSLFGNINRFQRDYFRHRYAFLSSAYFLGESLFAKPQFDALVAKLYNQFGFLEHYYVNFPDGALMIDEGHTKKRLIAMLESDYDAIIEMLGDKDGVDAEFLASLRSRQVVPNENYGRGLTENFEFWREMCQPAQVLDHPAGRLYYALFDIRDEIDLSAARFFGDFEIKLN
jgi:CheY-like chemotaxis protein